MTSRAGRLKLPEFITDLGRPPTALAALIAGSLALIAVGLDPRVFSAGTADAQAALREQPALESLFLLSSIGEAAFLLVGGVLGDTVGRRRVLLAGLTALAIFEIGAMVTVDGPIFLLCRIGAVASVGCVLPPALAMVAVAYEGAARATALGIAYAALGAATAVAPAVLAAVTPAIGRWPSFLLVTLFVLIALFVVWRRVQATAPSHLQRRDVYPHALWALGLLSLTGGIIGFRGSGESLVRVGLIIAGVALVGVFLIIQRKRKGISEDAAIDIRPTTVALVAGVVIAIAQTAPSIELPLFFQIAQDSAPLLATIALAPFIAALLISGPIAGWLLVRYSARALIVGGLVVVAAGDLFLGQATTDTPYVFFIVPFFAVGAGFVVGTCVRTAVIFASTPRRLPATAAALNQTSLVVGSQVGVAGVTALVSSAAIAAFSAALPSGVDPGASVDAFKSFLQAIGTTEFGEIVGGLSGAASASYREAFAAGVQSAMVLVALVTLAAAVICWFAMPGPERVDSVWEHREERQPVSG